MVRERFADTSLGLAGPVLMLLFYVWWRGHTFAPTVRARLGLVLWPVVRGESEPLDCDEAIYAYIGRRLVTGDVMYRDLTENKPLLGESSALLSASPHGAHRLGGGGCRRARSGELAKDR